MGETGLYVGLDIGGTKLLAAAADGEGRVIRKTRLPTPADLDEGLAALHAMIREVSAGERIEAIGAAIGGPLDWRSGVVSPLHQPQWREVPLKSIMAGKWHCAFHVDVDTNIAALGEYSVSADAPRRFGYITISTGMGGGFLIDGKIYRGAGGGHPEIAHQSVNFRCSNPRAVACECGAPDCLEALVSGNGIKRIYGKPAEELEASEWDEVAYNLGQGLRNIAATYLPDVIVLGGGVALGGGQRLIDAAAAVMAERLRIVFHPRLRLSRLGAETALVGALTAAREGLE
ncbi:MAG: ROK family protein [Planctomycetota bacterium]|jgi:predicted NBD/HSP70 family sugar kinase